MLRTLALTGIALSVAVGLATPAVAAPDPIVEPCHGTTYKYGARVTNPVTGEVYRLCIEQ